MKSDWYPHHKAVVSSIPYQKGSVFLWYLEEIVGQVNMEQFLLHVLKRFAFKTMDSNQFQTEFNSYFEHIEEIKKVDWDSWFYKKGMPLYKEIYLIFSKEHIVN